MQATPIELTGTLKPDGTIVLDQKPELPPGPVKVTLQAAPGKPEDWWEYLQRARAELEAMGYPFLGEEEMNARIAEIREDDDRIEQIYREMEQAEPEK